MLRVEHVTYQYSGADKPSLIEADLTLDANSTNLFWGDNGAGKSTLGLVSCGAIPHFIKGAFSGSVCWQGTPLAPGLIPRVSSFLFQNPYVYFQGSTLADEMRLVPEGDPQITEAAHALLPDADWETPLHQLSLGQQQRVALCSVVLRSTPMIFLDEPFESLDDASVEQATALIRQAGERNRIIVIIHRPQRRQIGIDFHRAYGVSEGVVSQGMPGPAEALNRLGGGPSGSPSLIMEGISFKYPGRASATIHNASLALREGEAVGLNGPNGCGKTTLLLLASGLLKPTKGGVRIGREAARGKALRRDVKCAFQNPDAQLFSNTVKEEVEFGLRNLRLRGEEIDRRVEKIQAHLPFDLAADPFSLSYGQKKLLTIVATFAMQPKAILLDEPTAGLDTQNVLRIQRLAEEFLRSGGSILVSSHSLNDIAALCHKMVSMEAGRIVSEQPL